MESPRNFMVVGCLTFCCALVLIFNNELLRKVRSRMELSEAMFTSSSPIMHRNRNHER